MPVRLALCRQSCCLATESGQPFLCALGIGRFLDRPHTCNSRTHRLQQINGFDMASPEKALEAYARLRTADHLTVQLNRRGAPLNLDFNIK